MKRKDRICNKSQKTILILIFFILSIVATVMSLSLGTMKFSLNQVMDGLFNASDTTQRLIIFHVRLPRTIAGGLIGMALSISGALLQGVMRNHLASPSTIGVSSGASFVAYITIILFPNLFPILPVGAVIGAFLTTISIYSLAYERGVTPVKMILAGLAVSAVFGASTDLIKSLFPERLEGMVGFLVGSLNGVIWENLIWVLPYILIAIILSFFMWEKMNLLLLGDEVANSLGLNSERVRFFVIVLSSVLAGSSIAIAGLVPFVGLIIPHISRLLVGGDYKYLLPMSALMGYSLILISDTLGRIILPVGEISVSVIISFLGAPFFLYILRKRYRRY